MTTEINFAGLGLAEPLLRAITDAGYAVPTPVQAKAIPIVLAGGDLLAAAQTGTGKTAGFVLPILQRLSNGNDAASGSRPGRPRCLILTPTRELAAQVEESVRTYGKYVPIKSMAMFGGVGIQPQVTQLRKRVDILVATPGRLLDHAGQRTLDLSGVEILVLDEGDRMLDMGFIPDVKRILALMPKQRQNMLFSATFSNEIRALANTLLNKPGCIDIAPRNTASELVEQSVHMVGKNEKRDLLSHLIRQNAWQQVLVFTRTKHGANRLTEKLQKDGIGAVAIHGNKSQAARTRALADFKRGEVSVLVATDIAARGLDIAELPHVVNFELPHVAEDYVHRIGRTGRAGVSGAAVSLVDAEEIQLLRGIEKLINRSIDRVVVEGFVPSPRNAERDDERPREPRQQRHQHKRAAPQPQRQPRRPAGDAPRHAPRNEAPRHATRNSEPRDDNWGNRIHAATPEAARGNHRHHTAPRMAEANRNRAQPRDDVQRDRQPAAVSMQQEAALSEAARHQALPQPALFSPRPGPQRRRG